MAPGDAIQIGYLGLQRDPKKSLALDEMGLDEVERALIKKALVRHDGNVSQAAKVLGLSRSALYRRMEKHGL